MTLPQTTTTRPPAPLPLTERARAWMVAHPLTTAFYTVAYPVLIVGLAQSGMAWT